MPTTPGGASSHRRILIVVVAATVVVAMVVALRYSRTDSPGSSGSSATVPSASFVSATGATSWSSPAGTVAASTPAPSTSQVGAPAAASSAVTATEKATGARMGLSMAPVGNRAGEPWTAGIMTGGPAWSTIKLPIVLANLHAGKATGTEQTVRAAITRSDNTAAENLTRRLGNDASAAKAVDAELARHHDTRTRAATTTDRPDFSVLGQTMWSLPDQTVFMASMACTGDAAPIRSLMGQVTSDQRWGLGTLTGARFKGGWGPGVDGKYLVRQTGIITVGRNQYAVSMEAVASDGTFQAGTAALGRLASRLPAVAKGMPAGSCS